MAAACSDITRSSQGQACIAATALLSWTSAHVIRSLLLSAFRHRSFVNQDTNPYAPTSDTNADVPAGDVPHLDPPQQVRYHFTAEMLAAFWTHRTLTSPSDNQIRNRAVIRSSLLSAAAAVVLLALAYEEVLGGWIAGVVAAAFLARVVLLFNARRRTALLQAFGQAANRLLDESPNENMLSERTVTFEVDGVRQQLDASESFLRWAAFERIEHDDDYLFLYESSISAIVVPRTAFATRGRFLAFGALARRLWVASSPGAQPNPTADAV